MKKTLFTILVIVITNQFFAQTPPTTEWSDNATTAWYNSQSNTHTITTGEELAGLSILVAQGTNFGTKTILLGADIDLGAHLWTPIGVDISLPFSGEFAGNGYAISNLFVVNQEESFMGLFGRCTGATITDLTLINPYLRTSDTAGSLVGSFGVDGQITNCHTSGVDLLATGYNVGGLVGELLDDCHMLRCSSQGSVTGSSQIGGLLGSPYNLTTITECYSAGTVSAQYLAGGLIGYSTFSFFPNRENTITNCYSRANMSVINGRAGGLCGGTDSQLIIENSYSTGTSTGPEFIGGFIGAVGTVTTTNNYWDTETSGLEEAIGGWLNGSPQTVEVTTKTTAEMTTQTMVDLLNQNQPELPWSLVPSMNDGYPVLTSIALSVTEIDNDAVDANVFPTVFDDVIHVESTSRSTHYMMLDMSGKLVGQGELNSFNTTINTTIFSQGTYLLMIQTADGAVTSKVMKR